MLQALPRDVGDDRIGPGDRIDVIAVQPDSNGRIQAQTRVQDVLVRSVHPDGELTIAVEPTALSRLRDVLASDARIIPVGAPDPSRHEVAVPFECDSDACQNAIGAPVSVHAEVGGRDHELLRTVILTARPDSAGIEVTPEQAEWVAYALTVGAVTLDQEATGAERGGRSEPYRLKDEPGRSRE